MRLGRRAVLTGGLAALSCAQKKPMASIRHRPLGTLPVTTLDWLQLRDHFVATVGPSAGQGTPLGAAIVLADATFAGHSRFPLHRHEEMEILSVVIDGDLSHHGDGANGQVIKPRGAQLISSRDGMRHAEGNETDKPTRMLQLWFEPTTHGGPAAYFYRQLDAQPGQHLLAGDDGMPLRCDVKVWWLDVAGTRAFEVPKGRQGYLLALAGPLNAGTVTLATGDGATLGPGTVTLEGQGAALWLDIP